MRRLRFNLQSMLIAFAAFSVLLAICVRHYQQSEQQRERVQELKRLGGSNAVIWLLYDDYAKWNEELGEHQIIVPASDVGGPKGITGWVKKQFGIHFLYKPVVLMYDFRDTDSEFKLTDEMVALIRSLPIREIRLSKSRYIGAERFNMMTRDEYLRVVKLFPEHVVVKMPDEVSSF